MAKVCAVQTVQDWKFYPKGERGRQESSIIFGEERVANPGDIVDDQDNPIQFDRFKAFGYLAEKLNDMFSKATKQVTIEKCLMRENEYNDTVFVDCNISQVAEVKPAKTTTKRPFGKKA